MNSSTIIFFLPLNSHQALSLHIHRSTPVVLPPNWLFLSPIKPISCRVDFHAVPSYNHKSSIVLKRVNSVRPFAFPRSPLSSPSPPFSSPLRNDTLRALETTKALLRWEDAFAAQTEAAPPLKAAFKHKKAFLSKAASKKKAAPKPEVVLKADAASKPKTVSKRKKAKLALKQKTATRRIIVSGRPPRKRRFRLSFKEMRMKMRKNLKNVKKRKLEVLKRREKNAKEKPRDHLHRNSVLPKKSKRRGTETTSFSLFLKSNTDVSRV